MALLQSKESPRSAAHSIQSHDDWQRLVEQASHISSSVWSDPENRELFLRNILYVLTKLQSYLPICMQEKWNDWKGNLADVIRKNNQSPLQALGAVLQRVANAEGLGKEPYLSDHDSNTDYLLGGRKALDFLEGKGPLDAARRSVELFFTHQSRVRFQLMHTLSLASKPLPLDEVMQDVSSSLGKGQLELLIEKKLVTNNSAGEYLLTPEAVKTRELIGVIFKKIVSVILEARNVTHQSVLRTASLTPSEVCLVFGEQSRLLIFLLFGQQSIVFLEEAVTALKTTAFELRRSINQSSKNMLSIIRGHDGERIVCSDTGVQNLLVASEYFSTPPTKNSV